MKNKILNLSLSVLLLAIGAASAQAVTTSIAVEDSSFESTDYTGGLPDNSTSVRTGGDSPDYGDGSEYEVGSITDNSTPYTPTSDGFGIGVRNPGNADFTSGPGNGDHTLPATADGYQALFINAGSGELNTTTYTGASLGNFVAGDTYTLTVAIGDGNNLAPGGLYSIDLLDNGQAVKTASSLAGPTGTFSDLSLSFVASNTGAIGFDLGLTGTDPEGNLSEGYFDNVRLTQTSATVAAPEPSAIALMVAGGLALVAFRSVRRRNEV